MKRGPARWWHRRIRRLDLHLSRAIFFLCMFGIAAHGLLGNHAHH